MDRIFAVFFLIFSFFDLRCQTKEVVFIVDSKFDFRAYSINKYHHLTSHFFIRDKIKMNPKKVVKISLEKTTQLRFPTNIRQQPVYIFPGDTIEIKYSPNRLPEFYFIGKNTNELNFLSTLEDKNIGVSYLDLEAIIWHDKINAESILEEHDRLYDLRMKELNKYSDSLKFASKYYQIFKNEIKLMHLLGYMQPFFKTENKTKLSQLYFDKLESYKQWLATDTTLTPCYWYRFAILSYNMYLNRDQSEISFLKHLYFSAKQNFNEPISYFVQFHLLHDEKDKSSHLFQECLNDFRRSCPIKDYTNHLDEEIAAAKLATDSLVYDKTFLSQKLIDINGKNITWKNILEKNKGKVTYTDMWASWCGPCRMEMPHSIKLQNELSNEKLSYVYISIDNDKAKWLKAITATRLNGKGKQHYLLDPNSKLAKFLTPSGIPKYFIINKEGTVEHLEAPRPSDPKTKEILTDLVHK